jgi:glycosyltransferase involved in cell wall biosynthesis
MVEPLISVLLATRDRPDFLPLALEVYRRQTYRQRELIVVDDGEQPASRAAVEHAGGRLLRLDSPAPLGAKLNMAAEAAKGTLCAKMDDDDWYARTYLETMVSTIRGRSVHVCRPTLAFLSPFLFFDLADWIVRWSDAGNMPGATLVFARADWIQCPFRGLSSNEDLWFLRDQMNLGVNLVPVSAPEIFLAVRHSGSALGRRHTWRVQWHGQELDAYLTRRPTHRRPESILPRWAIARYRALRRALIEARAAPALG